ncbi:hypothetical protein AMATHDRAFT_3305 [Amanita thiersii Skay4041]|uniref:RNA-dependent RNA polymerase n=1 Tax=Amanita thiersii Skay4041 TaxID=703135 RepID=A0A2A9NPC4_9AGAR|nr:hypothetical protein AMATHDRAFT_3305 [Amanita thiersii Skay4041]
MEIGLAYVPTTFSQWDFVRLLQPILHSEEFSPPDQRLMNFKVKLNESTLGMYRNSGTGTLTLPTESDAKKLVKWTKLNPIIFENTKIKFYIKGHAKDHIAKRVTKAPFIDPNIAEERQLKLWDLQDMLRIDAVQFGILYRAQYPVNDRDRLAPRSYSIEWEHDSTKKSVSWLAFEYDHKLLRIKIGDQATEGTSRRISVPFDIILRIGIGYDPKPYICFDTISPPEFEEADVFGDDTGKLQNRRKITAIDPRHSSVAPYAHQLRLVLYHDHTNDLLEKFQSMCQIAGIAKATIVRCEGSQSIEASRREFYHPQKIYKLKKAIAKFSWSVAFQLEALLHNTLLHPIELEELINTVSRLCRLHPANKHQFVGNLLRRYIEVLPLRSPREAPLQCFERIRKEFVQIESRIPEGNLLCYHVTFAPSRMLLEGPYTMQSNRIIREYRGYEENFVRVNFSEENKMSYRWERGLDVNLFLEDRVGRVLKEGFTLAGQEFEFLAYSNSALREHAVWFMKPFYHPDKGYVIPGNPKRLVNSAFIRDNIGDFRGTDLLRYPSKYAARLGQAFTSTDPSVKLTREQFEEVDDLGTEPYLHTDGVGTISKALSERIWLLLKPPGSDKVEPSGYQIRFLGYKGMVSVDRQLDADGQGIEMRLRKSMRKFENSQELTPEVEIAQSFQRPNQCYLNRPLIMLLEDLGVRKDSFMKLQDEAVADAKTIHNSIESFRRILVTHSMGHNYHLSHILERLSQKYGLKLKAQNGMPGLDTPFLERIRQVAMISVLREIKHNARIPVPGSYHLVGVADEGPAHINRGNDADKVFTLPEGHIYVCIQESIDKEPVWLEGSCSISRSPVAHPGDVQRVQAIGKPPDDKLCLFAELKNVVVLPSTGSRSLASKLGGGDLDGDQFSIIMHPDLLPTVIRPPANYEPESPFDLGRDSQVDDICDFIVTYIYSDVIGLVSDRLLIIADQSREGMFDIYCKKLARLCSKAVDFPKNGNPVNLEEEGLPSTLIREKPDWHAAEVVSPRDLDYYESDRALGYLFRAITLEIPEAEATEMVELKGNGSAAPLTDAISLTLMPIVEHCLGFEIESDEEQLEPAVLLFRQYVNELSYICATHTISTQPNARLQEAEVVAGTILDSCTQKRYRQDRTYRMKNQVNALVHDVRRQFVEEDLAKVDVCDLQEGLRRAWLAWEQSQSNTKAFGANSFGLIALGMILDILDKLC